jgi:hypothetical protein
LALRRDIFSHHMSHWISPRNEMGNLFAAPFAPPPARQIDCSVCAARKGVISGNRSQR